MNTQDLLAIYKTLRSAHKNHRRQLKAQNTELLESLRFLVNAANTEPGMAIYKAHIEQAEALVAKENNNV